MSSVASWRKAHEETLKRAIDEAENATGHQILVSVGSLGRNPKAAADKVASAWPTASIVLCVDPSQRLFEVRWHDASHTMDEASHAALTDALRSEDLPKAVRIISSALPPRAPSEELPDIVAS